MPGPIAGRLRKELIALGYGGVRYWTYRNLVDDAGKDPNTTFGGFSSFFYIQLSPPLAFPWTPGARWGPPPVGDGILWGQQNPVKLWGMQQALVWHVDEIRRTIAKWKPAGTSCRFVEVWLTVNMMGAPIEIRRFPCHEPWEQQSNGAYREFYNYSYSQERV